MVTKVSLLIGGILMKRLLFPVLVLLVFLSACRAKTVQKQTDIGSTTEKTTIEASPEAKTIDEKEGDTEAVTKEITEEDKNENELKIDGINQHFEKDINMDGTKEIIDISFGKEKSSFYISINCNGKKFNYEGFGCIITDELYIADLDDRDKYVEFYILDEGPSDDPRTYIFRLTGEGIKQIMELDGYLSKYDGKGKMYTEFCKTYDKYKQVLAHYDLDKGVIYASKEELQGKTLEYDTKLVIHKEPLQSTAHNSRSIFDFDTSEVKEWVKEWGDSVRVTEPGEKLKILDIDNSNVREYGKVRNIAIKVETTDGVQGWIGWLNGGD